MKKIIFLFGIFILFIFDINALTYSEWSEEYPKGVKENLIESEERYKWYKDIRINEEYLLKDEGSQLYIDEEDFIKSKPFVTYMMPDEKEGRDITISHPNMTFTKDDITHLNMMHYIVSGDAYVSEIEIYENDKLIDYDILKNDKYDDLSFFNDGKKDEYVKFKFDSMIKFSLNNKYDINNLKVIIYYKYLSNYNPVVTIGFSCLYNYTIETNNQYLNYCAEGCTLEFTATNSKEKYNFAVMEYTYTDTLYKKYDIKRVYHDEYVNFLEGYIKDESTKKTFYRYITNEYILIDINGNIVKNEEYCNKNFCFIEYIKEESESITDEDIIDDEKEITLKDDKKFSEEILINNPKTYDFIGISSIIFIVFVLLLILSIKKIIYFCRSTRKTK